MELRIERAVPGGRMLAHHGKAVVLVSGAIPGELVRVRVERSRRHTLWAAVEQVIEPSGDRRPSPADPRCGGMDYAHIAYPGQLACKREIVRDAMRRIGRLGLPDDVPVAGSPERGYRLRARLHVDGGRAGFFREGSHTLCDAAETGQLRPETVPAVDAALRAFGDGRRFVRSVIVAENVAATDRVVHIDGPFPGAVSDLRLALQHEATLLTGVTAGTGSRVAALAGSPRVSDTAAELFAGVPPVPADVRWSRHAASFFQANRFLAGDLVRGVLEAVHGERVADLYAGVGLFSVALAARGHDVIAVEGDRASAADLAANAEPFADRVRVVPSAVEEAVARMAPGTVDAVVVDPPRTGLSSEALDGVLGTGAARLVYVSCDPATLARDTAKVLASGYALDSLRLFDLFPNTAHVESLAVFSRGR